PGPPSDAGSHPSPAPRSTPDPGHSATRSVRSSGLRRWIIPYRWYFDHHHRNRSRVEGDKSTEGRRAAKILPLRRSIRPTRARRPFDASVDPNRSARCRWLRPGRLRRPPPRGSRKEVEWSRAFGKGTIPSGGKEVVRRSPERDLEAIHG